MGAPDEPQKHLSDYLQGERPVRPLGSGSDYTVMLQHLGIASSDVGFSRGRDDPVYHYHSIYDSEYWQEHFGDVNFHRHTSMAQLIGLSALRMAQSVILPLNITDYTTEIVNYAEDIRQKANASSVDFSSLDFTALEGATAGLLAVAKHIDAQIHHVYKSLSELEQRRTKGHGCKSRKDLKRTLRLARSLNKKLKGFEGMFIDPEGLDGRQWYSKAQSSGQLFESYFRMQKTC